MALTACTDSSTPAPSPSPTISPSTAVALGDVAASAPPDGVLAWSQEGVGPYDFAVTTNGKTKSVYFNVACDSGSFSLKNNGRLIVRGDCDARLAFQADAPVDYVKGATLSWTVSPSTNWRIAAWTR